MNFDDSPEEAAYRLKVRAWIAANKPDLSVLGPEDRVWTEPHKDLATRWQVIKAASGYACIGWPTAWGGSGGTAIEEAIFNQEEQTAGLRFSYFVTGLHMLLPAVLKFNDDDASRALVPPAVRGDTIWCQLFSEPAGGSDSAGLRTRAVEDGDDWIVTGQKVWNSGAQIADYGMVVTRTDPTVPKHKGLTAFWLRMDTPGVEVRPIKMMSGDAELNEVFLSDVRISDSQRVGAVGDGWAVIIFTLMNERAALGSGSGLSWRELIAMARNTPAGEGSAMDDPAFREWLADYYVDAEAIRLQTFRNLSALSKGEAPGPEGSAGKLLWANGAQDLSSRAVDLQDRFGLIDDPELAVANGAFHHRLLWAPGLRLGGGTDEIMKNIIAERVLGLPGEPRVDKTVPFKDIPSGR
ncbi:acyl-CoA dehydrogenase family protein [uncultured Sphingomonas sp.]|uniref:acyl-CoA dehydrogenase family protein n=1 Tax=uncultured Sphingomonas sp. TaxID=158754 RepID=UPI00261345D2|nr:acyl-CoA dehydrogenase family protein [uncultured Sphingomonas sp.]